MCVSGQLEICPDTIMGDTLCLENEAFCAPDGGCIDNKWKGAEYNYCNGGEVCEIDQSCGSLCSGICCDAIDLDDKCQEKIKECLPNYGCSETKSTVSCCKHVGQQGNTNGLADCIGETCKNLQCGVSGSNGSSVCCTYDKATPVGCVNGCIPDGQVCYDQPVSNSNFKNPTESGIYPNEVPNEIGSYCSNGDFVSWFVGILSAGFVTFDIYFQPAGFDARYHDGVYHVEEGDKDTQSNDNWISVVGNAGEEILIIEDVWIFDNLEGNDCPHGPYAQFYILIHKKSSEPVKLEKPMLSSILNNTVYGSQIKFLKGPFSGSDTWKFCLCYGLGWLDICFAETCFNGGFETGAEQEWVDYLKMKYTPGKAGIHKWEKDEEQIYFTLRERDGNASFWGIDIIRWDDFMGLQAISKKETKKPCGQTIKLYVYQSVAEDDDPNNDGDLDPEGNPYYYKTNKVGARIKFRTITCTGKAGDPC
jgi:hypothetical protein